MFNYSAVSIYNCQLELLRVKKTINIFLAASKLISTWCEIKQTNNKLLINISTYRFFYHVLSVCPGAHCPTEYFVTWMEKQESFRSYTKFIYRDIIYDNNN